MAINTKESLAKYLWFAGVTVIAGILYIKTACPTVEFIDSGELAVNCLLLGIPHPTGYPLYVLLGRFAVLLLPGEVIFRCHLLSLICTSLSAGLLFVIIKSLIPFSGYKFSVSASISLFMAFSPVWWSQGTANEVYCFTLLADLIVILLFVKYIFERKPGFLLAGFYIWGLSFGSHMSTIFLMPAIIYLLFITDGIKGIFKLRYLWAVFFLIIALSVYIYLPVRASFKPFLNWGNPVSLEGFINHISAWQYRVWMFKSPALMLEGISYFFTLLHQQFGVSGLSLTVVGIIIMLKKRFKVSMFLIIIIVADIIYSSNYEIVDIDAYYLLGFAGMAIFAGAGLAYIIGILTGAKLITNYKKAIKAFIVFVLIALPAFNLFDNYYRQDKSRKVFAAEGVKNMLASMDKNGIALVENWDLYSPWLYFRYALNIRPDVVMIDKELLRRSWYLDFLMRRHPDVVHESERQIAHFLELLKPFETGEKFSPQALTAAFQAMISSIIITNIEKRPVYTNILKDEDLVINMARIPVGVLYQFKDKFSYVDFNIDRIDFSAWESPFVYVDKRAKVVLSGFLRAIRFREGFCRQFGYVEETNSYSRLCDSIEKVLKRPEN